MSAWVWVAILFAVSAAALIVSIGLSRQRYPSDALTVAEILSEHGELDGLGIVKASRGRLKRGSIYVTLMRMEDEGLIEGREGEMGPYGLRPRHYRIAG